MQERQILDRIKKAEQRIVDLYTKVKTTSTTPKYKTYLANIFSQNLNINSPVIATIGHSDLSAPIVWTNIGNSAFRGTLNGTFINNKTFTFNNIVNGNQQIAFTRENDNSVLLVIRDLTGAAYPGPINNLSVKIQITN